MTDVAPFRSDRFASAIAHYRAYRLRYPDRLLAQVIHQTGLSPGARVLDLGCGPGFLAITFAKAGFEVLGLDPDPAMLAAARAEAAETAAAVTFQEGSSYDLGPELGTFDLVAMGRSFHWMDRPATLRSLEPLVRPGGTVALLGDDHERTAENNWQDVVRATMKEFAPPDGFSFRQRRLDPDWTGHIATLLSSAFSDVDRYSVWERHPLTLEAIIGRALSTSSAAPDALGTRRAEFEARLAERLAPLAVNGGFSEVVECHAVMARRPGSVSWPG